MSCRFPSRVEQLPSDGSTKVIPRSVRAAGDSQIPSSPKPHPAAEDGTGNDTAPTCETYAGSMRDRATGCGLSGSVTSVSDTANEKVDPCDFGLRVFGPATQAAWMERSGR